MGPSNSNHRWLQPSNVLKPGTVAFALFAAVAKSAPTSEHHKTHISTLLDLTPRLNALPTTDSSPSTTAVVPPSAIEKRWQWPEWMSYIQHDSLRNPATWGDPMSNPNMDFDPLHGDEETAIKKYPWAVLGFGKAKRGSRQASMDLIPHPPHYNSPPADDDVLDVVMGSMDEVEVVEVASAAVQVPSDLGKDSEEAEVAQLL